jgi:transposase
MRLARGIPALPGSFDRGGNLGKHLSPRAALARSQWGGPAVYDAMKRHEVQVLKKAGLTLDQIAKHAGMSRRSVAVIAKEPSVEELVRRSLDREGKVGRPSVATPFSAEVQEIFKTDPDLPTVEVLRRIRLKGYRGGKTALYQIVAALRPRPIEPVVRFEGVPGEFSQHDFGHVDVKYVDGRSERIHFFASRLKWSRFSAVTIVPDEALETLVRALLDHLSVWGGLPLLLVFDNPKTIVLKHDGPLIEWNPTFAQVAVDLGAGVELCTKGRGQEKGSVENLVKWVKNSFFKVRRFHDHEDLKRQLAEWLHEGNTQRPSRATKVIPATRLAEEQKRLRMLPIMPEEYALRIPITVGPTSHVDYNGIRYSMPTRAMGIPGTLFLYRDRVKVIAGPFSAEHPRNPVTPGISWRPEHRAELLTHVAGERGKLYLKRQQIFELGPDAVDFLTEIVHTRRYGWKTDVEKLYELLTQHGAPRLLGAIREAARRHLFGAEYVAELIRETA